MLRPFRPAVGYSRSRGSCSTRIEVAIFGAIRQEFTSQYHNRRIQWTIPAFPREATVPLEAAVDVLLLASRIAKRDPQTYIAEVAFAHEMAARNRRFAATAN